MGKYFMGIDIGTSESKGVLINDSFQVVVTASTPHETDNPKQGYFEHDAEEVWWKDFCILSRALVEKAGIKPEEVACVGPSTLGTCCVPVDRNNRPLRKAILYGVDNRGLEMVPAVEEYFGAEKAKAVLGGAFRSDSVALKILWIRRNEPEVFEKTHKFLSGTGFLVAKLTGEYKMDRAILVGSFRPMYTEDGKVIPEMCEPFCLPEQLPESEMVANVAGYITEKAAEETGLAAGTPVTTGTGDSTAESIGGGLVIPGKCLFQFGSTLFFFYAIDHMVRDGDVSTGRFTVPGLYSIGGGTNAAGALTKYIRDKFYWDAVEAENAGGPNAYAVMAEEAGRIPAGSEGLVMLPYILGERSPIYDSRAKGMLIGLTDKHTRHHINRAALEAVAYTVRQHVEKWAAAGAPLKSIKAAGGGTKNRVWMQMTADVTGLPVELSADYQTASYGDAMMAAIGEGTFAGFEEMAAAMPKNTVIEPDMEKHKLYDELYHIYDELYQANKGFMHRIDAFQNRTDKED